MMCFRSIPCIQIVTAANKEINHTHLWYLITVSDTKVPYLSFLEQQLSCILANIQHIHKLFLCNYIRVGLELVFVVFFVVHSSLLIPDYFCVNNRDMGYIGSNFHYDRRNKILGICPSDGPPTYFFDLPSGQSLESQL